MKKSEFKNIEKNGFQYELDENDRVIHVEGSLDSITAERNQYNQRQAGGEDRLLDDHGGHLIGARFGGSSEPFNLVPMNDKLNLRDFKGLENEWQSEIDLDNDVKVEFDLSYESDESQRPSAIMIKQIINEGEPEFASFGNIDQTIYDENPEYDENEAIDYAISNNDIEKKHDIETNECEESL